MVTSSCDYSNSLIESEVETLFQNIVEGDNTGFSTKHQRDEQFISFEQLIGPLTIKSLVQ